MKRITLAVVLSLASIPAVLAGDGILYTTAGTGIAGTAGVGGPAYNAQLNTPVGLLTDAAGNLFIADYNNNRVVRVDAASRILTLVAGNGQGATSGDGGPATMASLNGPSSVAFDPAGNLYISEYRAGYIRKVNAQSGIITTIAGIGQSNPTGDGGPATSAGIFAPGCIVTDAAGNLYIGQFGSSVRRIDAVTGIITTIPTGAISSNFLALDSAGNLFVADSARILKVAAAGGAVTTVAGNGTSTFNGDGIPATSAGLGSNPMAMAVDGAGNLYIEDMLAGRIRRVDAATGLIFTVAGNGISRATADFDGLPATSSVIGWPEGIALTAGGTLFFTDNGNRVRQVNLMAASAYTATSVTFNPTPVGTGQSVTLTANVVSAGGGSIPTGQVTFFDSQSYAIGTASLFNGAASLTISAPMQVGSYTYSAAYGGAPSFASSFSPAASLAVQLSNNNVTVTLTSTRNPTTPVEPLTYTATVTPQFSSSFQPSGTMRFLDGNTLVGTASVVNGVAQLSFGLFYGGDHSLTAVYSGDTNFAGATSAVLDEVVKFQANGFFGTNVGFPNIGTPVTLAVVIQPSGATGTIQFFDASTPNGAQTLLATVPIANGQASFTTSSLSLGTHYLSAAYGGDATYLGFVTDPSPLQVTLFATTVTLTSGQNPGNLTAPVTFVATVTPNVNNGNQPAGVVQLMDGTTVVAIANLTNGTAQLPVTFRTLGAHMISAVYTGDATFQSSTSMTLGEIVKVATTMAFYAAPNPSIAGSPVTFTATVQQSGATGTIELDDVTTGAPVSLGISVITNGTATFTLGNLSAGTHNMVANYSGSDTYMSASAPLAMLVKAATTTAISASTANAVPGQSVQFTATITPSTATGTVQFFEGGASLGTAAVNNGVAVLAVSTLAPGSHNVNCVYSGDGANGGSGSSYAGVFVKTTATAVLSSSLNPSIAGQAVTFTVQIAPSSAGGTVQLMDGTGAVSTLTLINGAAAFSSNTLAAGSHSLTAVYGGDTTYTDAVSPALVQVIKATTATSVSSNNASVTAGQPVQFTATVTPAAATGSVQFLDGATVLGAGALTGGTAALSTSGLAAGTHTITAVYAGDAGNAASTSPAYVQTIVKAAAAVTLASSLNPSIAGQPVTFTVQVAPAAATGSVQLMDGGTAIGSLTLTNGAASLTTSALASGGHSLTAVYSGDAVYNSATSAALAQVVKAATVISITSNNASATAGQAVLFTATVTPAAATGSVQFLDGATLLGTSSVSGGAATFSTSTLAVGAHSITATYSGDAGNAAGTSAPYAQSIVKIGATVTLASSLNPSNAGQSVTLTVHVSPVAATGTVQILDGAAVIATPPLTSGTASFTTAALVAGSHSLTAVYSGDAVYTASSSPALLQTVKASTTTTLASNHPTIVAGQPVQFTATVAPSSATGTVQFADGATVLGTVALAGGSAALSTSALSVGTHSITATYSGDANNVASTSAVLTQTVTAAPPGAPASLTAAAASSSQINLAWVASPTGGVTYNVYSSSTSGFTPAVGNRIAAGLTGTTYSNTGLAPSTTRYYLVTAQNGAGESLPSNQAGAATQASGMACHVVYTVTTQWNVGFGTAITIKNTGTTPINGWNLTWTWANNQQITQSWNANYTQTGANAKLTNMSYNPTIAAGATLTGVGFNASYSGTNAAPTAFYVNGTLCQ